VALEHPRKKWNQLLMEELPENNHHFPCSKLAILKDISGYILTIYSNSQTQRHLNTLAIWG
jgi:hypothetical protein